MARRLFFAALAPIYFPSALAVGRTCMVLLVTSACATRDFNSSPKHDVNQPVRSINSMQWNRTTLDDLSRMEGFDIAKNELMETDPIVLKAQFWIDRFDAVLRDKHKNELANVPKPKIHVLKDSRVNANVVQTFVCEDIPFDIQPTLQGNVQVDVASLSFNGDISARKKTDCIQGILTNENIKNYISFFNTESSTCQLKHENNRVLTNSLCNVSNALGVQSAKQLARHVLTDHIFVNIALVAAMPSEFEFAAIIAHELGHYYRANVLTANNRYNFFYQQSERGIAQKPTPDLAAKKTGLSLLVAEEGGFLFSPPEAFHESLLSVLKNFKHLHANMCTTASCKQACSAYMTAASDTKVLNISSAGFGEQKTIYLDFANKFRSCSKQVLAVTLDEASISKLLLGLRIGTHQLAESIFKSQSTFSNLFEPVLKIDNEIRNAIKNETSLREQFFKSKFGFYTVEQESDEFSLELLSLAGVQPNVAIAAQLSLAFGAGIDPQSVQKCRNLSARNWIDEAGNVMFTDIGPLSFSHREFCFRAFNMSREILAHRFKVTDIDQAQLTPVPWTAIKKKAIDLLVELDP